MATHASETITRTIRRWIIPAAEPWGAAAAEVGKAWHAAEEAYRAHHDLPTHTATPDNALRFHVTDEAIVISFETEEPAS